jgi:zinc transporter 1/2/3
LPLHVGAVFIILAVSLFGVSLPILSAQSERCGVDKYFIVLGKQIGAGIVLACALVHMLQPAASSLTNVCVPKAFNTDYTAYAYMFAMVSALLMHFFETMVRFKLEREADANGKLGEHKLESQEEEVHVRHTFAMEHLIQSYTMELALTVHSVFIGLTVGTVGYEELSALLTALCFHQFFEGVALGSRLADTAMPKVQTALFVLIFSLSAPIGITCGIIYASSVNPNGISYLLVEGIFDGLCAGLLFYVGFQLLLIDFPEELNAHCKGKPYQHWRRAGMFAALWMGAGFMAFIGKYL